MDEQDDLIDRLIQSLNDQPGAADLLVAVLSDRIRASQRSGNLQDASHEAQVRWLNSDGTAVTVDSSGVGHDLIGEGYFDTVRVLSGNAVANATNPRQLDLSAAGGADCLFSVLVSSCFSTLPGWVEGNTYTSLSGCSFKTSLTPQLAADYIRDNFSNSGVIAICKGSYDGGMHIHHGTNVSVLGVGREQTTIKGANPQAEVANGYVVDAGTSGQTAAIVKFADITIDGTIGTGTPSNSVFGNQNGCTVTLNNVQINVPASINGAQFNGNETISGLRIVGPSSGTQATTGCTSANNTTTPHDATNVYISGCGMGMKFTNAARWRVNNLYITGANATRGDSGGAGALAFHTGPGLNNSQFTNVTIVSSAVAMGFTNQSGQSNVLTGFHIESCTVGLDIRGSTTGISNWVFDDFAFVLGTAGDVGVDFTNATNSHCTYCQFTNMNFRGYASGNEILNASGGHIGTGTVGYHNVSDAGTVADFGNPLGHTGLGAGVGAASNAEAFVTIGNSANLSAERALTSGSGVGFTDAGANSTVTAALANLTADWTQAGVFDISTAGNLTVLKHASIGSGSSIGTRALLNISETLVDPAGSAQGVNGTLTISLTGNNANQMSGLAYSAVVSGAFNLTGTPGLVAVQGGLLVAGSATVTDARNFTARFANGASAGTVTNRYGYYVSDASGASLTLTNQHGIYIEALTKGGTLNIPIRSLGGASRHVGALTLGADASPAASGLLDMTSTTQGVLVPRMTTTQRDAIASPATGLLVYNTTTNTFDYYNGASWSQVGSTTLYSYNQYMFVPDAAPAAAITAGNQQGGIYHSGPSAETADLLQVDAETAPGASGLPITVQYGDTNDLDTVASWTTIATVTLSSEMSTSQSSMTNATIPASRLIRMNVGTIVGSPADATITLRVKRPLTT